MTNCDNHVYAKGRILLVDDDKAVRDAVYTLLVGDGYLATAAPDGRQGLTILHHALRPFNLLVTDCNMPPMSGVELARACLRRNPEIGILYMSGSLPDEELLAELEDGRKAFLLKPFQSDDLLCKVRQLLLAPRFEPRAALIAPLRPDTTTDLKQSAR